jgi:hypothetical protein
MSASSTPLTRPVRNIPAPPPHSHSTQIEPPFTLPSPPPHRTRCRMVVMSAWRALRLPSGPRCPVAADGRHADVPEPQDLRRAIPAKADRALSGARIREVGMLHLTLSKAAWPHPRRASPPICAVITSCRLTANAALNCDICARIVVGRPDRPVPFSGT